MSGERFAARLDREPGDRFAVTVTEGIVGTGITVVTASGRRVAGNVVEAHVEDGDMHVTIETSEPVLPPLDPGDFPVVPAPRT